MKKLYKIMSRLLENEYDLHAMLYIMDKLEQSYGEPEEEQLKYQIRVIASCLRNVSDDIREVIDELDGFLAVHK